jgi:hypothetical protein
VSKKELLTLQHKLEAEGLALSAAERAAEEVCVCVRVCMRERDR